MKKLLVVLSFFLITGCTTLFESKNSRQERLSNNLTANTEVLTERSRQFTTAIVDAQSGKENPDGIDILTLELARLDQEIEGLPIERLNVDTLLALIQEDLSLFRQNIQTVRAEIVDLKKENISLEVEVSSLNKQLEASRKGWISSFFSWIIGLSIPGIILVILSLIFFPAIAIPIFTLIIKWIISAVPQLIGFFGVVSKHLVDSITKGIQQVREDWKKDPDGLIKKGEALKLLDTSLSTKMDGADKKIISERKNKLGL